MNIDPNLSRKGSLMHQHVQSDDYETLDFPLFSQIELSVTGLCNRTCEFCPRADPEIYPNANEHMPPELHLKIVTELGRYRYAGLIGYSGFSEPLLHKQLDRLLQQGRAAAPLARQEVYTNGDQLTAARIRRLFDAGLTSLHISMYDGPEQQPKFRTMGEEAGCTPEQVILRERYLPREEHYGLTLSNRAGMISFTKTGVIPLAEPLKQQCFYPFYMMMVDHKGDVMICSHDWGKRLVAGNLERQSVAEVWNGKVMHFVRGRLADGDRRMQPCRVCDVGGTYVGGEHFERWQRFYREQEEQAGA
jgi:radical SAM protein with 4Fe4S-binding SPASM domain